jgi:uncharacterized protein (TIRG00374 family)
MAAAADAGGPGTVRGDDKTNAVDAGWPKRAIYWALAGLVVSTSVILAISLLSGVNLSDMAKIGYAAFFAASAVSVGRLLVQVVRFRLVAARLVDPRKDLRGLATARMASEFIALSTPSMSGGEFVRGAWLNSRGVEVGKAFWIGYFELIAEVYVASALGLVASVYAFSRGAPVIGGAILVVVVLLTAAYTVVFLLPALRGPPKVPRALFHLASRLIGRTRARHLMKTFEKGAEGFSAAASAMLRRESIPLVTAVLALTVVEAILFGLSLWIVLSAAGVKIDLLSSTLVAYGGITISAIPISIGGSGVMELAVQSYLSSVFGYSSWTAIVMWRIASFQVLLVITGVAFALLLARRRPGRPLRRDPSRMREPAEPVHEVPLVGDHRSSRG